MSLEKKHNKKARLLLTLEYPPNSGGVGRYLESIVREAADVLVVRPQFFRLFWPRWLKALAVPFSLKPTELWISHLLPLGYVALIYKFLTGTPYTIFVHGTDVQFAAKSWWKRFLMKLILNNAKQIVANSKYTLSLMGKFQVPSSPDVSGSQFPKLNNKMRHRDKFQVIYPCPTFTGAYSVSKKLYSIVSVGRLVPRKGFDSGIEAAVQLKKEFPDLIYTIIGNGPEEEKLKMLISKNNASGYIKIIINADDAALQNYYSQSEILLAPGIEINGDVEGFGLVILEAAQFGVPSVATNVGGVSEAIVDGKTGVLLVDSNVETIVTAISKLFKNDALHGQMGETAKQRVEREFNIKEQIKKLIS